MQKIKSYTYNQDSLLYEEQKVSGWSITGHALLFALTVVGLSLLYVWLYVFVFKLDLPKTAHLQKEAAQWETKVACLNSELDHYEITLSGIEERDDHVYRSIFGLDDISDDVKKAGFGGVNRYEYLEELGGSDDLKYAIHRLDVLTKRAYLQTNALDEVSKVARQADFMNSCIPAVAPILPKAGTYRISSYYGGRMDPVYHHRAFHQGMDFATSLGNPVYATGDGTIEYVKYQFFGYGNEIIIDHGFGYKTRYAHLNSINVKKGQMVKRGEKIGEVGNTGKSTGPHLHYEVMYRNKPVNPSAYMDLTIKDEGYSSMTNTRSDEGLAYDEYATDYDEQ